MLTTSDWYEMQKKLAEVVVEFLLKRGVHLRKAVNVEEYEFMKKLRTGLYENIEREGIVVG